MDKEPELRLHVLIHNQNEEYTNGYKPEQRMHIWIQNQNKDSIYGYKP